MNVKYHRKAIRAYLKDQDQYLDTYQINHIIDIARKFHNMEYFNDLPEGDFIISSTVEYLAYLNNVYDRLEGFKFNRELENEL